MPMLGGQRQVLGRDGLHLYREPGHDPSYQGLAKIEDTDCILQQGCLSL